MWFVNDAGVRVAVNDFFKQLGRHFFEDGIFKLPKRWDLCIKRAGDLVGI